MQRFIIFGFVAVGLVIGVIASLVAVGKIPTSSQLPEFATVNEIENRFKEQVVRIVQLSHDQTLRQSENGGHNAKDEALFSDPVILGVKIMTSPNSYQVWTDKRYKYQSRISFVEAQPVANHAIVNRYWDTTEDGKELVVLEYHRRLLDTTGNEVAAILIFDFDQLDKAANSD